jgi:hypothetical protein
MADQHNAVRVRAAKNAKLGLIPGAARKERE